MSLALGIIAVVIAVMAITSALKRRARVGPRVGRGERPHVACGRTCARTSMVNDAGAVWDDSAAREIGAALREQRGFCAYTPVRSASGRSSRCCITC
jgi:hypothetical protein